MKEGGFDKLKESTDELHQVNEPYRFRYIYYLITNSADKILRDRIHVGLKFRGIHEDK